MRELVPHIPYPLQQAPQLEHSSRLAQLWRVRMVEQHLDDFIHRELVESLAPFGTRERLLTFGNCLRVRSRGGCGESDLFQVTEDSRPQLAPDIGHPVRNF